MSYYPFGLQHKGYNDLIVSEHNYGFGGKEENSELGLQWLDFGARNYNAALGRWMNIDPLAEVTYSHNPYHFAFNNPIYFIDPDGLSAFGSQMVSQAFTGYYDDGAGNLVYDPNVNNQGDVDALGLDGASYVGDDYYDKSTNTYYDENGVAHENYERNPLYPSKFRWSFALWLQNLNSEGNTIESIGSGFVIVGKGQTTRSNNRSENPTDDVYIPQEVISALSSFAKTGKNRKTGDRRTNASTKKSNKASNINKKVKEFKKGMSHAKKAKKYGTALGSISVSNSDSVVFIIQYWQDGVPNGGRSPNPVGEEAANEAVRDGMSSFPELDSIQKIRKN
ncbi:RHS repeat-associated core domain-containing protein [uncultured Aquimarina sp.]|uniref:RHS repeat-associated core domain-containing protein n=1 Tax=uncultured Aquimarina sp. TaxID=575652 RepID=UPI0026026275|nr:RHS repeat-associated core domain-containing protein [uncultured Aquimarina sp.]